MKLSVRGEYALRALLVLTQHYGSDVVRIQSISKQQNIPRKFLEQILNELRTLGVVESQPGPSDGSFPAIMEVEDRHQPIGGATLLKRTTADDGEVTDLSGIDKVRRLPRSLHR